MKKFIVYENDLGKCCIGFPNLTFSKSNEKEIDCLYRLYSFCNAGNVPNKCTFLVCPITELPTDLTFRDAWKQGDQNEPIKIDFELAIKVHRARLKEACQKKIRQLEIEIQNAIDRKNLPEQVSAKRTIEILGTLHEMNLTHCKTIEDIKYSIPRELHDVWDYYSPKPE